MAWKTSCVSCPWFSGNGTCGQLYKAIEHGAELGDMHMDRVNGRVLIDQPTLYFCRLHPNIAKTKEMYPV